MTSSEPVRVLEGACYCGGVRYRVEDDFDYAMNCHCSNCRRTTGAAFKPFAGIDRRKLSIVEGESLLMIFGEQTANNTHCRRCGSLLFSVVGAVLHVAMGTLIDSPTIRPTAHIFVGSKASWFTITDALPQYAEHIPP
jgi:hypothetical protein